MIKLWGKEAKNFEPRRMVNRRLLELKTAKQILEEIFLTRSSDVEDMIQRNLMRSAGGERVGMNKRNSGHQASVSE